MIKRIIFDLDNTLIPWNKEYEKVIKKAYEKYGIYLNDKELENYIRILKKYERTFDTYNKNLMTSFFNREFVYQMPNGFIDLWLQELCDCVPKNNDTLIDTIKYLNTKYELAVLTNWFKESQIGRLDKIGILKYFKEVISCDEVKMKPNIETFTLALSNYKPSECLMVGDNFDIDLKVPGIMGMKTILIGDNVTNCKVKIKKIEELKEML